MREAIFNALQSVIDMESARVVDLFAGTGALGIEALSRGASSCTFVERDRAAVACIRSNLEATGLAGGTVVQTDVLTWVRSERPAVDAVFADPPYAFGQWTALASLQTSLLVAESDREIDLGDRWRVLRSKRYGGTVVTLFEPQEYAL